MRLAWLALAVAAAPACGPSPPPTPAPVEGRPSFDEAERRHATECARGVVERGEVLRVGPSRYRGRAVVAVSLSSPDDDLVDAYYGDGPGCDLVAMVGGARLETDVRPGTPFQSLSDARRAALGSRDGAVAGRALERDREGEGRWAYRFDVESGGRLQAVFVDALGPRFAAVEPPLAPPVEPPVAAPPPPRPVTGPPPPAAAPKPARPPSVDLDKLIDLPPAPQRLKRRDPVGERLLPSDLYDQRH